MSISLVMAGLLTASAAAGQNAKLDDSQETIQATKQSAATTAGATAGWARSVPFDGRPIDLSEPAGDKTAAQRPLLVTFPEPVPLAATRLADGTLILEHRRPAGDGTPEAPLEQPE